MDRTELTPLRFPIYPELLDEEEKEPNAPKGQRTCAQAAKKVDEAFLALRLCGTAAEAMSSFRYSNNFETMTMGWANAAAEKNLLTIDQSLDAMGKKKSRQVEKSPSSSSKYQYVSIDGTVCSSTECSYADLLGHEPTGIASFIADKYNYASPSCAKEYITHRCKGSHPNPTAALNDSEVCEEIPAPTVWEEMIQIANEAMQEVRFGGAAPKSHHKGALKKFKPKDASQQTTTPNNKNDM